MTARCNFMKWENKVAQSTPRRRAMFLLFFANLSELSVTLKLSLMKAKKKIVNFFLHLLISN